MNLFDPSKWMEFGKELGAGTLFGFFILVFVATCSVYVLKALFGRRGFLREFFVGVKVTVRAFFRRLDERLDRLEAASRDSTGLEGKHFTMAEELQKEHLVRGGAANVDDIREAAICGLDGLKAMAEAKPQEASTHFETAKTKLSLTKN